MNEAIMHLSINACLASPGHVEKCDTGGKYIFEKNMSYDVGFIGPHTRTRRTRVIFNPRVNFVISTYQVA